MISFNYAGILIKVLLILNFAGMSVIGYSQATLSDTVLADSIELLRIHLTKQEPETTDRLRYMALLREQHRRSATQKQDTRWTRYLLLEADLREAEKQRDRLIDSLVQLANDTAVTYEVHLSTLKLMGKFHHPKTASFLLRHIDELQYTDYGDNFVVPGYLLEDKDNWRLIFPLCRAITEDTHGEENFLLYRDILLNLCHSSSDCALALFNIVIQHYEIKSPHEHLVEFYRFLQRD